MEENTASAILKIIREETGYLGEIIDATRLDTLVADSLEFLSLVCAIENAFHFKIPDKRYTEVQTVGDLCGFVPDYVPS